MADSVGLRDYEDLLSDSGGYRDIEIDMLGEAIESFRANPDKPYTVLEIRDGKTLASLVIAARIPSREYTFEIRCLCVDRDYISTKAGKHILGMIDEDFLRKNPKALIQYETSTKKLKSVGRELVESAGFNLIGHIPDFYSPGDDFFMYSKFLSRVSTAPESVPENIKEKPGHAT
ncbi:MAG: hypothetical protein Q8O15_10615 [Rectinemataceae bacterium]|nr:hypothetical protein [Rectinemataceae bacterium]